MVQFSVRPGHANSCKSSRRDDVMSIHVRVGRGQHNSDPIQCQDSNPTSDSHIGLHDSTRRGTRTRHRTVPGEPHSSHQTQTQKPLIKTPSSARRKTPSSARRKTPSSARRKTPSSAKTRVKESPKMDGHTNLKPGKNIDCIDRATVLLDWIIKPLPDIRGVCVEGQKQGMDDYWHSAAIVEAVRPTVVVTATGSIYRLEGKINKYCTIDNGFPKGVAQLFTKGFPHNWRQVIEDFYTELEDSISIVAETSPLKHKKLRLQQQHHKLVATVSKKKTPAVPCHKLKTLDRVHDSIWTPSGILKQKLSTDDVTVTRSGRISLPPLARWTGQCYRRVPNSSDIEVTFETDCAKRSLHNTTAHLLQLHKRCPRRMCKSSLSKSLQVNSSKLFSGKLNQTADVLGHIDEPSPVAADAGSKKKPTTKLAVGKPSPVVSDAGSKKKPTETLAVGKPSPVVSDAGSKKKPTETLAVGKPSPVAADAGSKKKSTETLAVGKPSPVASDAGSKKKSTEALAVGKPSPVASDAGSKKKPAETNAVGRKMTPKVRGHQSTVDVDTRPGSSRTQKKTDTKLKSLADKNNKSLPCNNFSEQSLAVTDSSDDLETSKQPGSQSCLLKRNSKDKHIVCDRSLRVVLSRHVSADVSSHQVVTQSQKLTRLPTAFLYTDHDSQTVRKSVRGVQKYSSTSSNVDSDSTDLQSADSSINKSCSKRARAAQTNQRLQADNSASRLQESAVSSSVDIQDRHLHRQTKAAKTNRKKTEKKRSATSQKSVRSDHKTDSQPLVEPEYSQPLVEPERSCLQAEGKPAELGNADKSGNKSRCSQPAVGVGSPPSTDLIGPPPAVAKRKQVSTTRKRKLDADDNAATDGLEGNSTTVERKPNKRRKVIDVTSAGDVPWSQEEQDSLHRALREVSGADSSYWQQVSVIVSTRSQTECQQFYRQYLEVKGSKKLKKPSRTSQKQKSKAGRKKGDPIRGGKGTLKRKQDLREFLQEQNEGYEDNLFEGTPFVNRHKQSSLFTVSVDKNDSEIFGANHNCITPVAGTSAVSTPATFLRAKMVSVRKTPQSDHVTVLDETPVSFNRRKADQFIKSFIDRQRRAEPAAGVVQDDLSMLNLSNLPVKSLFSPATHPSIIIDSHNTEEEEMDGEDDNSPYMYYWNEES